MVGSLLMFRAQHSAQLQYVEVRDSDRGQSVVAGCDIQQSCAMDCWDYTWKESG